MDTLLKDVRYGIRSLIKQPAFTAVAVLTLGLGIGANTTIFSVINALIINPPLFAEPDQVVAIWRTPTDKRVEGFASYPDLRDWQARGQSFESIAGYKGHGYNLVTDNDVERIPGMRVTANF